VYIYIYTHTHTHTQFIIEDNISYKLIKKYFPCQLTKQIFLRFERQLSIFYHLLH